MRGSITAQMGVFLLGAWMALHGKGISPGMVSVFVELMNYVANPISYVPQLLANRKAAYTLVDKLAAALSENAQDSGTVRMDMLAKGITLKDLSFSYDGEREIFHDVNFTFEQGKSYTVVGASGSGKSTLLSLLMAGQRYGGSIRYDDVELQELCTDSLYKITSLIQQNVFIFNSTIQDNITMFQDFPEWEVERVIRLSGLTELIQQRGKDYLCGENGGNLSGGEKQRISIARSLLRNSSVLLVDEATAALDNQTATYVSSSILDLQGLTRIIVTHDLDAAQLKRYDCILALRGGKVAESGQFEQLMEQKGYFYSLYTISQQ